MLCYTSTVEVGVGIVANLQRVNESSGYVEICVEADPSEAVFEVTLSTADVTATGKIKFLITCFS